MARPPISPHAISLASWLAATEVMWHSFETYKRTIWVNLRNRRTIFRCAGLTVKSNNSSWWKRLLAVLRLRKRKTIVI